MKRFSLLLVVMCAAIAACSAPTDPPKPCSASSSVSSGTGAAGGGGIGSGGGPTETTTTASSGSGGVAGSGGAGGACMHVAPVAAEQPCESDADCQAPGPCFVARCFPSNGKKLCQPFVFREFSACIECDVRALCDYDGMCTIPEP